MLLKERIQREVERLAKLHRGKVTVHHILEAAAAEDSPLHDQFEWDDTEAAQKWRLHQARQLLLSISIVTPDGSGETIRAMVSLTSDRVGGGGGGYRTVVSVLGSDEHYAQMLADALAELRVFQKKYAQLKELKVVFDRIDRIGAKAKRPQQRTAKHEAQPRP